MSLLLGVSNTTTQSVPALGTINIGSVYRRYCKKNNCGIRTFDVTSTSVTMQHPGIYHVTVTAVGSGDTAGVVTISLLENGTLIPGAFSSETITTADTELRTFVIDTYVLVDDAVILGNNSAVAETLTLQNTGIAATFTSVTINLEKVV